MEFLTIGRLAKQAGVNLETVRYYERRASASKAATGCFRISPIPKGFGEATEIYPAGSGTRLRSERNPRTAFASSVTLVNVEIARDLEQRFVVEKFRVGRTQHNHAELR